jgi:hypothetical protein
MAEQGGDSRAVDDAELGEVVAGWATLPDAVRLAILALVRTVK